MRNRIIWLTLNILILCSCVNKTETNIKMSENKLPNNSATKLLLKKHTAISDNLIPQSIENLKIVRGYRSLKLGSNIDSIYLEDWNETKINNNIISYEKILPINIAKVNYECNFNLLFYKKKLLIINLNFSKFNDGNFKSEIGVLRDDIPSISTNSKLLELLYQIYGLGIKNNKISKVDLNNTYIIDPLGKINYNNQEGFFGNNNHSVSNSDNQISHDKLSKMVENANKESIKNPQPSTVFKNHYGHYLSKIWETELYGMVVNQHSDFKNNESHKNDFQPTYDYNYSDLRVDIFSKTFYIDYINELKTELIARDYLIAKKNDSINKINQMEQTIDAMENF